MTHSARPPRAPRRPFVRRHHDDEVADPFAWMADQADPDLLAYLAAENDWTTAATAHLAASVEAVYADIVARTQQTDLSAPHHVTHTGGDSYWYFSRTVEGLDYPSYARLPATSRAHPPDPADLPPGAGQPLLDGNELSRGHEFWALGWSEVSPDGRLLAYSVDTTGDERYDLFVREIATGTIVDVGPTGIGPGGTWLGDAWLLYTRVDDAWRPHEVWRRRLGTDADADALVLREPDERFWLSLSSSRDDAWAVIDVGSKTTTECHLLPAADPTAAPRCVTPRRAGVDYAVEVGGDALYILHNDGAEQFELATAPLDCSTRAQWTPLLPGRADRRLTYVSAYRWGLVVGHRTDGLPGVLLLPRTPDGSIGAPRPLAFPETLHDVSADADADWDTDRIRLTYESLVTPPSVLEYHLADDTLRVLKRMAVLDHPAHGPYEAERFVQERLWATAPDGARIPISLLRGRDTRPDGTAPLLLYGYGSYEVSTDPYFATSRLSLLDRGFVFAIAHVRGGGELGRGWYDAGKLRHKRNTFTDFIACARHLVDVGWTAPDRLGAEGGSAGGLLVGAVINEAPELFRAVHAAVPFVDALTTILNPELPLTVVEWEEWGDPLHDPDAYAYMKSYSPYENVRPVRYPAILVTTSMNDTRVEVTEPAKWVARLREVAANGPDRPILLKTEPVAGHGGASARYRAWRDRAFEIAWLIDQLAPAST